MPTLSRYLTVAVLARLADEGARVSLVLLGLARTGSPLFSGALVAALMVPHVVAAPIVGGLADRVRRRGLFHACGLGAFAASLAAAALLTGRVPAAVVLVVVALGGCAGPLVTGGLTALLRDLVPEARRRRAYGLDATSYNLAGIGGPALVALVSGALGPANATCCLAGSVAVAALAITSLPLTPHHGPARPTSIRWMFRDVGVVWHDRTLRAVTVATSVGQVGMGALPLAVALFAAQRGRPAAGGMLLAGFAVGGLLGSLVYTRFPVGAATPQRVVMGCLIATGLPLTVAPLLPGVPMVVGVFVCAGFFVGPLTTALFLAREQGSPAPVHAQVFAVGAGLKMTAAAIGSVTAGALAGLHAQGLLLVIVGELVAGGAIGLALLYRRASTEMSMHNRHA